MIDLLVIFSVITLCVPADDSYNCDWQINLIDTLQSAPEEIYGRMFAHWQDENVVGFTDTTLKQIYIEKHAVNFYQILGCTTFWHEGICF